LLAGLLKRQFWPYAFRAAAAQPKVEKKKAAPIAPQPAAPRDPTAEVTAFLENFARATNHYEVLNIHTDASPAQIKSAYYGIARAYHPDRFHELANSSLHAQLEAAFARITQAHEVLSDPSAKSGYDAKLEALKRVGYSAPVQPQAGTVSPSAAGRQHLNPAEQRFQEGMAALNLGDANAATAALSAAARLAPNESKYRAYYGKALAAHPQTKRLAEAEIQAAIKIEPANAAYRVMLAGLYRELGFWRRAINELERALSLDGKNVEARRMLQSLETKK
jgi:curved DNA-binding protein CbpA